MKAIDRMGKNKAASTDELLDTIFQVKEWKRLAIKLKKDKELRTNWKTDTYHNSEDYKREKEDP